MTDHTRDRDIRNRAREVMAHGGWQLLLDVATRGRPNDPDTQYARRRLLEYGMPMTTPDVTPAAYHLTDWTDQ
jgi:hypothetical protein